MFEKSLYDLIRGLRNHKGNEREYIQNCLKECRAEIRGADMDLKATALLKLIYLEMMGHDMSWASFHVLEVMSSPKYHQKRVGYLGAVQSFRSDTEVLMLATNLLKKDLAFSDINILSLPIVTLPHVATPSIALSVHTDLLPRLSHSRPNVRKKTVVTLYRLALIYPEVLLAAWPKMRERLLDKDEDPSVTSAVVSVICELSWRRPHDFLPLAPRLFELLVEAGNNWMAIKLIKLFATLTPLEPRLVRKLLPPLTEIIRTTPAMSLLYECINGIIQGGILGSADDVSGREEIASLCVDKLRGMIIREGDANLTYVALLAFNRIVRTHPFLVSQQEDVILKCIDSPDLTIRIQALDLVQGMVSQENLIAVVGRLMKQLKQSIHSRLDAEAEAEDQLAREYDDEEGEEVPRTSEANDVALPEDYQIDVIGKIVNMCSQHNYSNIVDFDWYIDVLTQLMRMAPAPRQADGSMDPTGFRTVSFDVTERIGDELRSIAVKVKAMRGSAVRAADAIAHEVLGSTPAGFPISTGALKSAIWVLGEYATSLASPEGSLGSVLQILSRTKTPAILTTCLQAIAKIFSLIAGDSTAPWTSERKSHICLLMARIIDVFEPLALHPNLEVQERAVEFVELLKLTAEAASGQSPSSETEYREPPLLLTQAIPSLFTGWELNSVAPGAQANVPMPQGLDLDESIHPNLEALLSEANVPNLQTQESDEFDAFYHQRPVPTSISSELAPPKRAVDRLGGAAAEPEEEYSSSYQQTEASYLDPDIVARRKAERMERNKDDPFYIGEKAKSEDSNPIHNILQSANGQDLDIDSIPIMQLDINKLSSPPGNRPKQAPKAAPPRQQVVVAKDETLGGSGASTPRYNSEGSSERLRLGNKSSAKQSLLSVSSLNINSISLDGSSPNSLAGQEDEEMAKAMKEVERLRLEMQRANERIKLADGVSAEGVMVGAKKRRKTTKKKAGEEGGDADVASMKKVKKLKKRMVKIEGEVVEHEGAEAVEGGLLREERRKAEKKKKKVEKEKMEEWVGERQGGVGGGGVGGGGGGGEGSRNQGLEASVVVPKKKKKKKVAAIEG